MKWPEEKKRPIRIPPEHSLARCQILLKFLLTLDSTVMCNMNNSFVAMARNLLYFRFVNKILLPVDEHNAVVTVVIAQSD